MSAANLDAVKKKYKFKEIAVATWRDPSLSVLSARGGPTSPTISADSLGRAYIPTYKVKYNRLPEPTDDEDSGNEGEKPPENPDAPSPDEIPDESRIPHSEDHETIESSEAEQKPANPDFVPEEPATGEPEPKPGNEGGLNDEGLISASQDVLDPGSEEGIESQSEALDVALPSQPEDGDGIVADENATAEEQQREAPTEDSDLPANTTVVMDPEVSDSPHNEEHIDDHVEEHVEEHVDERRVSFAPDTPEPKPTSRKKKAAKGTKSKKKRVAVPLDDVPPDILAMIDSSLEGMPPPPPPAPEVPGNEDAPTQDDSPEPPSVEEGASDNPIEDTTPVEQNADNPEGDTAPSKDDNVDETPPDEQQGGDEQPPADSQLQEAIEETPPAPEPAEGEQLPLKPLGSVDNGDSALTEPPNDDSTFTFSAVPAEDDVGLEKPSKKKSSKSGKDKSKKKSSKTKARESSPPPAGLGIDIGSTPIPDIDDLLKDIPPATEDVPAPSQSDAQDSGDLGLPPSAPPDVEIQEDDPKPDETGLKEPDASDSAEPGSPADEGSEEFGGNDSSSDTTAQPGQASSGSQLPPEIEDPEKHDEQEGSSDSKSDSETPPPASEEVVGEDEPAAEPASSPADSGVEFEEVEKNLVEGGEDASSPEADKLEAEAADLPPPNEESKSLKDEQDIVDEEPSSESAPTEDEPKLDEGSSETKETSPDIENEGGDESQAPEQTEEQPVTGDDSAPSTEAGDNSMPEDVVDAEPASETKEEIKTEDAPAENAVDEGGEPEPSSEEVVPPDGEDSKDSAEPEPEAKIDAAEPEPVVESVEPDLPDPDPVIEETKPDAPQAEAVQEEVEPEATQPEESKSVEEAIIEDEAAADAPIVEEIKPNDQEPGPEAPPSPVLSKSSSNGSRKHKTHWERKHADNVLKGVFADKSIVLEKSKKAENGEVRVRDRGHKSHRVSSPEEDEARRIRRALRKKEEAARLVEEERRKLEEDKLRRIRRDERRAARKVDAEYEEKIRRLREEEEALRAKQREDEARRRRHRDRDREHDRPSPSSPRETKDTGPALKLPTVTLPKALNFANAQSFHGKAPRHAEELPTATPSKQKEIRPHEPPKDAPKNEAAQPSSSNGSKSHHRHRHHHRSQSDKSSRDHRDGDHRSRRHAEVEEERPKTLFGMLRLR